jgi:DNA-binding MarR family transcriptional regulator
MYGIPYIKDTTRAAARYNGKMPTRPAPRHAEVRAALDAFRRIVQALRLGAASGTAGLSSAQSFALQQIAEHPSLSINDLAALTFTHQSSVSVVVQRLVAQRMVAKIAAPEDRRKHCLVLTAKGRAAVTRAPKPVQQQLITAIAALPPADRRVLVRSLESVAHTVAPDIVAARAPMLFEERTRGRAKYPTPAGAFASGRDGRRAAPGSPRRRGRRRRSR